MHQYDYEVFLLFISKTFSLHGLAQIEPVELSITLDTTEIFFGLSHLTAGMTVTGGRAIKPRDGVPLCIFDGIKIWQIFNNQSMNLLFCYEESDCESL